MSGKLFNRISKKIRQIFRFPDNGSSFLTPREYNDDLLKLNFFRKDYTDPTNKMLVALAKSESYGALIDYLLEQDLERVGKMEFFDDEKMENRFSSRYILEYIRNNFEPPKNILDLGSGGAFLSYNIAHLGHEVSCVDACVPKILVYPYNHSEKRENDRIHFFFSLCESLPFGDDYFDIIYSQETLEHVMHLGKVLSEMRRVLKHDGTLIVQVPYEKTCDSTNHLRIFYEEDIKRMFPSRYFKMIEIKKLRFLDTKESYTFSVIVKKI